MIEQHSRLLSEADYAKAAIEYQETELEGLEHWVKENAEEIEFQEESLRDINDEITEVELEWEESHQCHCGLKRIESSCEHEDIK